MVIDAVECPPVALETIPEEDEKVSDNVPEDLPEPKNETVEAAIAPPTNNDDENPPFGTVSIFSKQFWSLFFILINQKAAEKPQSIFELELQEAAYIQRVILDLAESKNEAFRLTKIAKELPKQSADMENLKSLHSQLLRIEPQLRKTLEAREIHRKLKTWLGNSLMDRVCKALDPKCERPSTAQRSRDTSKYFTINYERLKYELEFIHLQSEHTRVKSEIREIFEAMLALSAADEFSTDEADKPNP